VTQRFIGEDGRIPEWLHTTDQGAPIIYPDKYGAAQLLLAASREDMQERLQQMEQVMRDRPAVPLLSGLISFGLAFTGQIYGPARDRFLDALVLAYAIEEANPETER
jgi:hypothetical protein